MHTDKRKLRIFSRNGAIRVELYQLSTARFVWLIVKQGLFTAMVIAALFASSFSPAADIRPDSVDLFAEHVSHISQHMQHDPTDFGYDTVGLAARWQLSPRFALTLSEGYNVDPCYRSRLINGSWCGALFGPREVFSARLSYQLWSK